MPCFHPDPRRRSPGFLFKFTGVRWTQETLNMYTYTNRKGKTFFLCRRDQVAKNGKTIILYYFSQNTEGRELATLPENRTVSEMPNGMPYLKKVG